MKIFAAIDTRPSPWNPDVPALAVDETGHMLVAWVSSNKEWAKNDIESALKRKGFMDPVEWVEYDKLPEPCRGCAECVEAKP